MKTIIISTCLILAILAFNIYKSAEKIINKRNTEIENIYKLLEIK